jgi:hypothetical protein
VGILEITVFVPLTSVCAFSGKKASEIINRAIISTIENITIRLNMKG